MLAPNDKWATVDTRISLPGCTIDHVGELGVDLPAGNRLALSSEIEAEGCEKNVSYFCQHRTGIAETDLSDTILKP
jgi:hypothetical protein